MLEQALIMERDEKIKQAIAKKIIQRRDKLGIKQPSSSMELDSSVT